ncbi:U3 small nucleolar RNA-associated protein 18 homolog isoform 1-T2 [Vipera latastei]
MRKRKELSKSYTSEPILNVTMYGKEEAECARVVQLFSSTSSKAPETAPQAAGGVLHKCIYTEGNSSEKDFRFLQKKKEMDLFASGSRFPYEEQAWRRKLSFVPARCRLEKDFEWESIGVKGPYLKRTTAELTTWRFWRRSRPPSVAWRSWSSGMWRKTKVCCGVFKPRAPRFQGAMGTTPSWALRGMKNKTKRKAKQEGDTEDEEDDDLLHKTGNFVIMSDSLPKGILQMKNCVHANNERISDAKLTTVQFHPTAQVVMTAGHDRSISLFQVDGITNSQIQSIHLEDFPIYKARFSAEGDQVIATSIHNKLFYIYDMMEGKIIPINHIRGLEEKIVKNFEVSPDGTFLLLSGTSGYLHLITMKTKEFIGSMKINGRVIASSFSPDGSRIYTHSDEGEVFIWDVKSRRCLNKFTDEGCLHGTSIAVSKNSQYIACGSNSGVVNVYAHDDCIRETRPKPLKAIMNLVTPSTSLVFNPTTEILAMASNKIDDALKLVHIPSFTVFSNFPVFRRKLLYLAYCMDFSPRSGYFSIANNKGKALLYRLKHYSDF